MVDFQRKNPYCSRETSKIIVIVLDQEGMVCARKIYLPDLTRPLRELVFRELMLGMHRARRTTMLETGHDCRGRDYER